MPADDHLRGMFDDFGPSPEPTDEQRNTARRELYAAMRSERGPATPWWRRLAVGWSAAAAIVAAVLVFALVVPTSTPPVDANLADIAAAARSVEPMDLPEGSYIYFRLESTTFNIGETPDGATISYLLPAAEDLWVSGMSELRQRTVADPVFDSPADEEVFYSAGLAEAEGVGETRTEPLDGITNDGSVDGLSTDTAKLKEQIISDLSVDPEFDGDEARILQHVAQLLSPRMNAPPAVRGALLEVLGTLDVSTDRTSDGGVTVLQKYEDDFGTFEQVLEFDRAGFLVRDTLTLVEAFEPGSVRPGLLQDIRYSHPTVVGELGLIPTP